MISFWILPLALIGLADALYLLRKKMRGEKLVCFMGDDCDKVVKSKYGYIAGIPNEFLGAGFYISAFILFLLGFLGRETIAGFSPESILLILAVPASLASLYLLGIQAFVLKEWCEYCLLSALVNFLILLVLLF